MVVIPFESQRQYTATLPGVVHGQATLIYVKGTVEGVLERCSQQMDAYGNIEIWGRTFSF